MPARLISSSLYGWCCSAVASARRPRRPPRRSWAGSARIRPGVRSAVNDTTRELGGTLGVAIVGSLFASVFTGRAADAAPLQSLPAEARAAMGESKPPNSSAQPTHQLLVTLNFRVRQSLRVSQIFSVCGPTFESWLCWRLYPPRRKVATRAVGTSGRRQVRIASGTGGRGRDRLGRRRRRKNMVPWRNTSRGLGRSKCPTALRQDRS
jgi:hypothetical protein